MIEYRLFDVEMCHNAVSNYKDKTHSPKTFEKHKTKIASENELRQKGNGYSLKEYSYASHNVGHIFGTKLDQDKLKEMFEEKDYQAIHPDKEIDEQKLPYLVNLHNGPSAESPYHWLIENGKDKNGNERFFRANPIKFFFCIKHENSGKIESHLWFFKGFCATTNPVYCQMIDAGTIPLKKSISFICKYMDTYDNVGGASGEIEVFEPSDVELGSGYFRITDEKEVAKLEKKIEGKKRRRVGNKIKCQNDEWYVKKSRSCFAKFEARCMILAQYVEYKISHYLDKSFESLFGFVSVLPGAFCTFRWEAISGDPMKSFFKGLEKDKHTAKEANMYLAEDRVMCLEILRKYSNAWVLRYIPGCIALTDPPDSVIGLIKQRRRWTNGSMFASWYVIDHLNMINRSGHSFFRKMFLSMLYAYMLVNFVFSLVLVGSLYGAFSIFVSEYFDEEECGSFGGARILETAYLSLLFIFILMSITKPISKSGWIYSLFVVFFGIFIFISIAVGLNFFWKNRESVWIAIMLGATLVGSYILPPIFNWNRMNLCKYFFGAIILVFLSPTYVNIIIIYSMANLHDVSWGNRETDETNAEATKRALEQFRALYLIVWIAANVAYGYTIIYITDTNQTFFVLILTVFVSGQVLIKLVSAVIYFFYEKYTKVAVNMTILSEKNNVVQLQIGDRLRDKMREQRKDIHRKIYGDKLASGLKSTNTGVSKGSRF